MNPETKDKILDDVREALTPISEEVLDEHTRRVIWARLAQILSKHVVEGTCTTCKHRNEGDGLHGMYCQLHEVACEYEAKCSQWEGEQ